MARLKRAAERARTELSNTMETKISLPFITAGPSGPKNLYVNLSRATMETLVEDLVLQYERAIQDYDEAIRLDPQDFYSYYSRGSSYFNLGQYERAIQDYDEAIRLDPQYADSYYSRGNSYRKLDEYEQAIQDYDEAIRLDPQQANTYRARGRAYQEMGRHQETGRDFATAWALGWQFNLSGYSD